jgi:hypothetical protein
LYQKSAVEPEGSHFYPLCKAVSKLHEQIPVPEQLRAFCSAVPEGPRDDEVKEPSEPQPSEAKVSVDLYKYRGSRKERAFVPGVPAAPKPSLDFISVNMDASTSSNVMDWVQEEEGDTGTQISKKRKFQYRPLRLKQTVPNPEKIKKKELKRRRR